MCKVAQRALPRPRHPVQPDDDVQPGIGTDHRHLAAGQRRQSGQQSGTPLPVPAPDAPHVPIDDGSRSETAVRPSNVIVAEETRPPRGAKD